MTRPISNGNLPAHPPSVSNSDGVFEDSDSCGLGYGMTKREAFAMAAMQGILSHAFGRGTKEELAIQSLECADALLKELAK